MQKLELCVHLRWPRSQTMSEKITGSGIHASLLHLDCVLGWCFVREGEMILYFALNPFLSLQSWLGYFWHLLPMQHDKKEEFRLPECRILRHPQVVRKLLVEETPGEPWREMIYKYGSNEPGHHDHMTWFGSKVQPTLP